MAEKILRKQLAIYDEILMNSQQAVKSGESTIESIVSTLIDAAHVFHKLSFIQSSEFDAKKDCTEFLVEKFLTFLNQWDDFNIKNPYQVSRYLAAIVIAQAEMVSSGQAEAGPQFFETMQEFVHFINGFKTHNIGHFPHK